jgi:diacylglycerol kinase (ATP)
MNTALLLHNPGAGDEAHTKEEIMQLITSSGHTCLYASVKDDEWEAFDADFDFLVIAGGDGTVRNVAKKLLKRPMIDKTWPIGLLPLGTANNIAKTLDLGDDIPKLIQGWKEKHIQPYDVGRIANVADAELFLESLGYGVFPYLMQQMKKRDAPEDETPEEKIKAALTLLHEIIDTYPPHQAQLSIDGEDHSGRFILLEVMNAKSIGPNLLLAPQADPGDGLLEIAVVTEADKDKFSAYITSKLNGEEGAFAFTRYTGKNITLQWEGSHIHVDDEVLKIQEQQEVKVELKEGLLEFLVP